MIDSKFLIFIKDKLKLTWLIFFMIVMLIIGFIINCFESYNSFGVLAPVLLIMMMSTIWVLKIVLTSIFDFKKYCEQEDVIEQTFKNLYGNKSRFLINILVALIIFIYFVCLHQLHFFTLNMMGCYILFLGGGTFLIGLIGYELHLRLTNCLSLLAKHCENTNPGYNIYNPKDTPWLLDLYKLSKLLRMSSFIIGLLFVFENALFFIVNINQDSTYQKDQNLPLELYIIWIFIFITITLAFPIMSVIQKNSLRVIIMHIEEDFKNRLLEDKESYKDIQYQFVLLQTIQIIEESLNQTYLLKPGEKFITISSFILTSLIHILSFLDFFDFNIFNYI